MPIIHYKIFCQIYHFNPPKICRLALAFSSYHRLFQTANLSINLGKSCIVYSSLIQLFASEQCKVEMMKSAIPEYFLSQVLHPKGHLHTLRHLFNLSNDNYPIIQQCVHVSWGNFVFSFSSFLPHPKLCIVFNYILGSLFCIQRLISYLACYNYTQTTQN